MTNGQKAALFVLLGIAIAAVSIIYIAKPNWESMNALKAENATLQQRLTELQQKQAHREEYIAETEEYRAKFEELLDAFPADLNQEISIMFMQGIRSSNDFDIDSLGLGEQEQFYTLGYGGGDAAITSPAPTDTAATDTAEGTEAASTEAAPAELSEGGVTNTSDYQCFRAAFPIDYEGSYESLKDVVAYINTNKDRMAVNSVEIAYNSDADRYAGSMNVMCYAIESPDRPERSIELNDIEIGVDNIFLGEGGVGSSSTSLNKYDENDGAAIETSYDFYALLNPSSSDVSAKVVGQNGTGREASVISNSDNTVSTLSFEFYEKDGKNYCKYTLDNSTSYEAEVTSAEDIKLLLKSSARKDDADLAGIRVSIRNTTSLPVYVKVSGDDATNPRVDISSKSGAVKVYK